MKLSGAKITLTQALLARIIDELSFISWTKSKDGQKNRNRPKSVLKSLTEEKEKLEGFKNADDFEAAWNRLKEESNDG